MQLIDYKRTVARQGDSSGSPIDVQYLWDFISDFCREDEEPVASSPYFAVSSAKDDQQIHAKGVRISLQHSKAILVSFEEHSGIARLREELAEAKHSTMLIASTSHELRTPLCGIINALELMRGSLSEGLQQYHEIALSSSKHLLSTVNDVLV